jgi:hypothetical protein
VVYTRFNQDNLRMESYSKAQQNRAEGVSPDQVCSLIRDDQSCTQHTKKFNCFLHIGRRYILLSSARACPVDPRLKTW